MRLERIKALYMDGQIYMWRFSYKGKMESCLDLENICVRKTIQMIKEAKNFFV